MFIRRVFTVIASGLYLGYIPFAPATFGSLWALPIWYFFRKDTTGYIIITFGIFVVGVLISSYLEKSEERDPRYIVIDEIAGLLVALGPMVKFDWRLALTAFLLFRFFDIIKPFPIRQAERMGRGIGIMADDVLAGCYAALLTAVVDRFLF